MEDVHRALRTVLVAEIMSPLATAMLLGDTDWHTRLTAFKRHAAQQIRGNDGAPMAWTLEGVAAVFDQADTAIACAASITAAGQALDLPVRAGLHAGEVTIDDQSVTGVAVLIAATVARQGRLSGVMATSTVMELSYDRDTGFESVGRWSFPGLPVEWELFRLSQEDGQDGAAALPLPTSGAESALIVPVSRLSQREQQVVVLIAQGFANQEIADELHIASGTAERHVANILMKLGFRSRTEIARWAVEQHLLADDTQ